MRPEHSENKATTRECKTETETKNFETETSLVSSVSVTVTEAFAYYVLLEDRGRIAVNPYPGARKQN